VGKHSNNKKRILIRIAVFCVGIMLFGVFLYMHSYNPNSIIPHRGLEKSIREQIGKPTGEITPEDCLGVTELDIAMPTFETSFRLGLSDLEGLQYFKDLEILKCNAGYLSDISALSQLHKLRELNLDNNNISDLTPLSELSNLEYLWLYQNNVRDLSPLASLTNLKHLVIGMNPVQYIPDGFAPLANLYGLEIGSYADYAIVVGRDELKYPH
jgi:Leucine-rich repeat (LRR) protein